MEVTKRFYDFCIPYNSNEAVMQAILKELVELGYQTIAIDQRFDHSKMEASKRGKEVFPEPHPIPNLRKEFENKIKILQRITILYVDDKVSTAMNASLNLRKFNIVAGQPKTDAALTHCCASFNGDIITFDPTAGSRLLIHRKSYEIAVRRRMFFEIKYSPAITDSNNRKDMIKIAQNYRLKGKSKNIIFSSGATDEFQLRGPYDVANLAFIFGLSEDQGKNAIDRFGRELYLRAESRRIGKTIMFVKNRGPVVFSDSSEDDDKEMDEIDSTEEIRAGETSDTEEFETEQPQKKRRKDS